MAALTLSATPAAASAAPAASDAEGRANRDRWHWQETELAPWLKKWMELNLDEQTLFETSEYKVRCRNTYRDSGECVLHARKGKFFATYNLELVVKWYAQHRLEGRVVGEARGRVRVCEFSSERVAGEEEAALETVVEGDWEYRRGGAAQMQAPDAPPAIESEEDCSEAERHLKTVVRDAFLEPLETRLRELRGALGALADARQHHAAEAAPGAARAALGEPLALEPLRFEASLRAAESTRQLVREMHLKLRPAEFEQRLRQLGEGTLPRGALNLRALCVTDDDIPALLAALPPKASPTPLDSIDLSYNDITDAGAQRIMMALAKGAAPNLTSLALNKTKLTTLGRRMLEGLKLIRKTLKVDCDAGDA